MTDDLNVSSEPVIQAEPVAEMVTESVASPESVQEKSPVEEKMIPQSEVNKIVAREKRAAAEKTAQRMEAEKKQQLYYEQQQRAAQQAQTPADYDTPIQLTPRQLDEQLSKREQQREAERQNREIQQRGMSIAQTFLDRVNAEIESDPEFSDVFENLEIVNHPRLVELLTEVDNTVDIMKDMAKNPTKFSSVLGLANSGATKLARTELNRLSQSIKANAAAKVAPKAPAPLSQIKPSSSTSAGSGVKSVSELRKLYKR